MSNLTICESCYMGSSNTSDEIIKKQKEKYNKIAIH